MAKHGKRAETLVTADSPVVEKQTEFPSPVKQETLTAAG